MNFVSKKGKKGRRKKATREKKTYCKQRRNYNNIRFPIGINASNETVEEYWNSTKRGEEKPVDLEIYIHKNIFLKQSEERDVFRHMEAKIIHHQH